MPSAMEECREPTGKCQRIFREFHIVWRVVTLGKIISEMTYSMSSWTLNSAVLYYTVLVFLMMA